MQNKTPILVLTGLGIVAAAAVAGLTRDQWMGQKPDVVAVAPAPETPKPAEPPAATPEAPQPAEQPPAAAEQPATAAPQPDAAQQTAAAQPETQPETQPEAPAADNAAAAPVVPAFDTVRVEKTGEAVIAGTAAPGSDVVVMFDGKPIGKTTANGDGAFVIVPDTPLPVGSGALTLEAKAPGAAAATPSQQSVAVIVPAADQPQEALVAVVSPDQPTKVLQKPEVKQDATATPPAAEKPAKLVSIDAVDYDPAGNIVFSGQGNEGNVARLYIDNVFLGDATVGADGRWTFSATADVAPGVHTLRVDGLDAGGKVLNRVEVPFVREEQKKVADATAPAAQPEATQPEATQPEATQPEAMQPEAAQPEAPAKTDAPATPEQPAAATPAKPKEGRVVIQPGNNLWRISRVLYGDGSKFTMLYEANKDQIRDPNRIYPGQVFRTPDVAPASETIDPKRRDPLKPEEAAGSGQ